jgi:hypothetical protein
MIRDRLGQAMFFRSRHGAVLKYALLRIFRRKEPGCGYYVIQTSHVRHYDKYYDRCGHV